MNSSRIDSGTEQVLPQRAVVPRGWARRWYAGLAAVYVAGVVAQVFFAGAGIFGGSAWMRWHEIVGHMLVHPLPVIPLVMLVLSFVARLPRTDKWLSGLLLFSAMAQPMFVYIWYATTNPLIGAFHPVNALLMFILPFVLFARTR